MRLDYLVEGGTGDSPSTNPGLATPSIRETSIVHLPALSEADAVNAAKLMARSHYPGNPGEIAIAATSFRSGEKSSALLHIIPKEYSRTASGVDRTILAPQDFLALRGNAEGLAVFITPGWIEWLVLEAGLPQRAGSNEWSAIEAGLAACRSEAGEISGSLMVWAPETLIGETERALGASAGLHPGASVYSYESQSQGLLSRGRNSFGPRKRRRAMLGRFAIIALAIADLALGAALIDRDLVSAARDLEAAKSEKNALLRSISEVARLKLELEGSKGVKVPSGGRDDAYAVLQRVARLLPKDARLASVDISGPSFRIAGTAQSAFAVLSALGSDGEFVDLTLDQATPIDQGALYRFSLSGRKAP